MGITTEAGVLFDNHSRRKNKLLLLDIAIVNPCASSNLENVARRAGKHLADAIEWNKNRYRGSFPATYFLFDGWGPLRQVPHWGNGKSLSWAAMGPIRERRGDVLGVGWRLPCSHVTEIHGTSILIIFWSPTSWAYTHNRQPYPLNISQPHWTCRVYEITKAGITKHTPWEKHFLVRAIYIAYYCSARNLAFDVFHPPLVTDWLHAIHETFKLCFQTCPCYWSFKC